MRLYSIQFEGRNSHLASACILSGDPIGKELVTALRTAQEVIEAQWLANFNPTPVLVVLLPPEYRSHGTQLFGNVRLINPEDWGIIDQAEVLLINASMYGLCRDEGSTFVGLKTHLSGELMDLFTDSMFVVAGVY